MKNPNAVRRRSSRIERLCLAPYSFWAVLFIVVPLIFVAYYAFTDNSFHFTSWHFNFYGSYPIYLMTISMFVILYDIKSSNKVVKFILSNISNATYALYLVSYLFDRKSYGDFNAKYPDVNGQWSMDRWHHVYQQHWYVFLNALLWGLVITVGYRLLAWLLSLAVKKLTAPKPVVEIPAETPPPATKE